MKYDIPGLLAELAKQRPIFHSEKDFQHAFAWALHSLDNSISLRLEINAPELENRVAAEKDKNARMCLDVWAKTKEMTLGIELKYPKAPIIADHNGERFYLRKGSGALQRRYNFINDIRRLEHFLDNGWIGAGYAILLTNDSSFWNEPTSEYNLDREFVIHEGRKINPGIFKWGAGASVGTMGKGLPLHIGGTYEFHWQKYSQVSEKQNSLFKYLLVEVKSQELGKRTNQGQTPVSGASDPVFVSVAKVG
jgi:hypothetical protein